MLGCGYLPTAEKIKYNSYCHPRPLPSHSPGDPVFESPEGSVETCERRSLVEIFVRFWSRFNFFRSRSALAKINYHFRFDGGESYQLKTSSCWRVILKNFCARANGNMTVNRGWIMSGKNQLLPATSEDTEINHMLFIWVCAQKSNGNNFGIEFTRICTFTKIRMQFLLAELRNENSQNSSAAFFLLEFRDLRR